MIKFILNKAVPLPKIEKMDSFLFVGPHPDDVEMGCGSTVSKLAQMGKKITILITTNGCVGGDENLTEQQLVEMRKGEALAAAQLLGVEDVRFLPYDDGVGYTMEQLQLDIVKVILDVKPQMIFCPDHTLPNECHPDHTNVGRATTDAMFVAKWDKITARHGLKGCVKGVNIAYYYTHKPNSYVKVKKSNFEAQMAALALHKSQFADGGLGIFRQYLGLRQIRFGARSGKGRAEGFRVLGVTHQHCFPERGE